MLINVLKSQQTQNKIVNGIAYDMMLSLNANINILCLDTEEKKKKKAKKMILVTLLYRSDGQSFEFEAKITCGQRFASTTKTVTLSREYQYGTEDNKANKRSVSNKR